MKPINQLVETTPGQDGEISRPLFVVSRTGSCNRASLYLQIHRMDGMPAVDRRGERLRSDRENWLTLPEALKELARMIDDLPQYSIAPRVIDDTAENLRRFNEEFGYEVVPENRKAG